MQTFVSLNLNLFRLELSNSISTDFVRAKFTWDWNPTCLNFVFSFIMWKLLACVFMASTLQARDLRKRHSTCGHQCDLSRCSSSLEYCYFGVVKDSCGCCSVCAAGEGDFCGDGGLGVCGVGMTCEERSAERSTCVCDSHEPVCGSDGRTYPSICRLKAENRRAKMSGIPAVIFIQRGPCETGEGIKKTCITSGLSNLTKVNHT